MRAGLSPEQCAGLIGSASRIVALTGAGLSTAAGIPDFRGPQGLYVTRRYDPERVFAIEGFRREPGYFYAFCRDFIARIRDVAPTFTHRFLTVLEQREQLAGVITQNIDTLHQQAGSREVICLHGSYDTARCLGCGQRYRDLDLAWWEAAMRSSATPPVARCRACDGVLKPDIVFFGEPVQGYPQAEELVAACDLLLVLGSSLQVAPASFLPAVAPGPIIVVNQGGVDLAEDPKRFFVTADLDVYFSEVVPLLEGGSS